MGGRWRERGEEAEEEESQAVVKCSQRIAAGVWSLSVRRVALIAQLWCTLDLFIRPSRTRHLSQSGFRSSFLVQSRIALF